MRIDCDTCRAPATACDDCVMTVLLQLGTPPARRPATDGAPAVELDAEEFGAIGALARAGLVPPLRLVVGVGSVLDAQDEPGPGTGRPAPGPGRSARFRPEKAG